MISNVTETCPVFAERPWNLKIVFFPLQSILLNKLPFPEDYQFGIRPSFESNDNTTSSDHFPIDGQENKSDFYF